jgi:hypothetical protein
MPRLPLLLMFFKPEASTKAADALPRVSAPREPISGEFPVIKTRVSWMIRVTRKLLMLLSHGSLTSDSCRSFAQKAALHRPSRLGT